MLNAKTVAFLGTDNADVRERNEYCKNKMAAAGVETVYEQYASADTQDFTSYLTKIKYTAPDVVCIDESSEGYLSIGKQIAELGGLGKTKLLAMTQATTAATKTKGFEGQYVLVSWLPGLQNPGAIKFEQDYKTVNGGVPNLNHIYYYLSLWTATHAIEMAGTDTDRVKIAEIARSGNLEWDAPVGHIHFNTDGTSDQKLTATHVEGGNLVPITLPE
jgi:ABC-type branched-subunit amino acid transport system substrate-binding protein